MMTSIKKTARVVWAVLSGAACLAPCVGAQAAAEGGGASARTAAGALYLPNQASRRAVYGMNVGWRFLKGPEAPQGVYEPGFDDSAWERVNLPHGLEVLPEEASGCCHYSGPAWYRKTFDVPGELAGRRVTLYFEGIMGKSEIWVNGHRAAEHFGGYLPVVVDAGPWLKPGCANVVVVKADNSNDPSYPPGTDQESLDFAYFGGIYRDAYLLATDRIYITDPQQADSVAGGGVFFRTEAFDPATRKAAAAAKVQVANDTDRARRVIVEAELKDAAGRVAAHAEAPAELPPGGRGEVDLPFAVSGTRPWSPDDPCLYRLDVRVTAPGEGVLDDMSLNVGLRTIELTARGLVLNGAPFPDKLIGGNRHQDFATLGNAVPNNLQQQDAVTLRRAGMRVIRSAHYPQDPAFMDACDRLGLFVIVATPGWQFWGRGPFAERVYSDIRRMVRRDRNRPSVLLWEPILNETHYPADFAQKARDAVHEEYPYAGCYTGCDSSAAGATPYEVLYAHPPTGEKLWADRELRADTPYFTREFGDNVDDWASHNSPSRASRAWGEGPMLVQAMQYLKTPYPYTTYETLNAAPACHFGGCLWHPFDHQRGYHPDPFYGGILDAFRQPKTAYYAFMSQRPVSGAHALGTGPMVYVANECTPFSPQDVTVFSNCEAVRLRVNGGEAVEKQVPSDPKGLAHAPVVFPGAWDFMKNKELDRNGREREVNLVAEGLVGGRVAATHEVRPARRPEKIRLRLDGDARALRANGSDVVVAVAEVVDARGTVKRLHNEEIKFTVEGPAELVTNEADGSLTRRVEWGSAPALVRLAATPGKVTLRAEVKNPGAQKPVSGTLSFETQPGEMKQLFDEDAVGLSRNRSAAGSAGNASGRKQALREELEKTRRQLNALRNEKVGAQQARFE